MCGFTGFFDRKHSLNSEEARPILESMNRKILHRGPDDEGLWIDANQGIALAHRRLSILDLSAAGHQPMISQSQRYVLVFNGEIYNHLEIRRDIEQHGPAPIHHLADQASSVKPQVGDRWRGHSDTETLLAAIETFGVGEALSRSRGMFAFALWDRHDRLLYLARDRMGEKPLYYGWQGNSFLFGSELKALEAHPDFRAEIDRNALSELLRLGYIPGPGSIYSHIHKLPPGTYLAIGIHRPEARPVSYWSAADAALRGQMTPFSGDETEAVARLDSLLRDAVASQMVADVPLGAFLSGGIDSSLVTALMQAQSNSPIQTFSIGFEEEEYNEAPFAKAVAQHLGTHHTEWVLGADAALAVIPDLPTLYDEPFADVSQIPTHLVSRLASQSVKVALTGDGGDELFGGYNRHFWTMRLWNRMRFVPQGLRRQVAHVLTLVPPHLWDSTFRALGFLLPEGLRYRSPGDKLHKLSRMLGASRPEDIYFDLIAQTKDQNRLVTGSHPQRNALTDPSSWPALREIEHRIMYLDSITYLPDDILTKLDRAAMGVSLEGRVPLLDHRIVEFAWQLPLNFKIREGRGKHVLRQVLSRYVPETLTERPKMGFGVPIDRWLREPLKDWSETLIQPERLKNEGFFHPKRVQHLWKQHLSGRKNHASTLWSILMFQSWLESRR
jgi:asparagine synthase (glutamine-hydrolysing)